ncbi:YihA family ribosome biogenesis GTP-binding protein [bacterium]|nr:YihA family ribosome biogenesis GTP-binding protein [bacterium]
MRVLSVEFKASTQVLSYFPAQQLPEIVFAGRSNVGKSSLINCLVHRKKMAHASSQPGRTRSINFYDVNRKFALVDLPGYGYSKASKSLQTELAALIEGYLLLNRASLIISIVDSRRPPGELDVSFWEWLITHKMRFIVVATKMDKIPRSKRASAIAYIVDSFEQMEASDVVSFSSKTRIGRSELWGRIISSLSSSSSEGDIPPDLTSLGKICI